MVRSSAWKTVEGQVPDGPASRVRARLPLFAVPKFAVPADALRGLMLDADSAYLLSLVDGVMSVQALLETCEMNPGEAHEILAQLLDEGVLELRR